MINFDFSHSRSGHLRFSDWKEKIHVGGGKEKTGLPTIMRVVRMHDLGSDSTQKLSHIVGHKLCLNSSMIKGNLGPV